jgi:hypothetical protein
MTRLLPLLLAVAGGPAPAGAGAPWRVVVQDTLLPVSAATQDKSLAAGAVGGGPHVLQVVETKTPLLLLSLPFPDPINALAFTPDKKRLAVSTARGVWLVTLADGRAEEILPGTSGVMTFNAGATLLGVLGHLADGQPPAAGPRFGQASELGAYDLKEKRWRAKSATPILIEATVVFEGDELLGYGRGGRVFHRAASSFRCDVRLNVKTGAAKQSRGVEQPGRGPADKAPGDANYQTPRSIAEEQQRLEEIKKIATILRAKLSASGGRDFHRAHFAGLARKDRVVFAAHRVAGTAAMAAAVTVREDGVIEVGPAVEAYEGARLTGGTLACPTWAGTATPVIDLLTGKPLFEIPKDQNKHSAPYVLFPAGALVSHGGQLSFYKPRSVKPAWAREQTGPSSLIARASPDGQRLALYYPDSKILARVFRAEDGKPLCEVPRPEGVTDRYAYAMSFDPSGARFAVLIRHRLLIHDVATGKLLADQALPREDATMYACGLQDGWLLSGLSRARIWDEKKGWTADIPIREVNHVEEIASPAGKRLLLDTGRGVACIADPASGKILMRWIGGGSHSTGHIRERPPDALAAFGGRLLVRSAGWAGVVDLVDLRTLKTVVTIQPVPVVDRLGWVAYTPDGLWDASAGAERLVKVFRGDQRASPLATGSRRDGATIRARLKAVCGGG